MFLRSLPDWSSPLNEHNALRSAVQTTFGWLPADGVVVPNATVDLNMDDPLLDTFVTTVR
jgi:hypothetical protein